MSFFYLTGRLLSRPSSKAILNDTFPNHKSTTLYLRIAWTIHIKERSAYGAFFSWDKKAPHLCGGDFLRRLVCYAALLIPFNGLEVEWY